MGRYLLEEKKGAVSKADKVAMLREQMLAKRKQK